MQQIQERELSKINYGFELITLKQSLVQVLFFTQSLKNMRQMSCEFEIKEENDEDLINFCCTQGIF